MDKLLQKRGILGASDSVISIRSCKDIPEAVGARIGAEGLILTDAGADSLRLAAQLSLRCRERGALP